MDQQEERCSDEPPPQDPPEEGEADLERADPPRGDEVRTESHAEWKPKAEVPGPIPWTGPEAEGVWVKTRRELLSKAHNREDDVDDAMTECWLRGREADDSRRAALHKGLMDRRPRRARRRPRGARPTSQLPPSFGAPGADTPDHLAGNEGCRRTLARVEAMTGRPGEVLRERLKGWKPAAIAKRLRIAPGTVRWYLHAARKQLRERTDS